MMLPKKKKALYDKIMHSKKKKASQVRSLLSVADIGAKVQDLLNPILLIMIQKYEIKLSKSGKLLVFFILTFIRQF